MKHKLNKQKGFTLIELLVVIAIISLLSSVVLASLKSAREKAMLSKTVSEMKSLQTAVEMYRNEFGYYPDERNGVFVEGEPGITYVELSASQFGPVGWSLGGGFSELVEEYLVVNKFISKTPQSPNYPNNCQGEGCIDNGYFLGYSTQAYAPGDEGYYMCGENIVKDYAIFFYANSKKIDLPIFKLMDNGVVKENPWTNEGYETTGRYTYCLAM